MKALQVISIALLLAGTNQTTAQISFQKKFGGAATGDNGQSVVQASDSGYYIAGVRVSGTSTFIGEGILKRTDKYGNELWTKYLSTPGSTDLTFDWIEKTTDGNLVVAGIVNYGMVNGFSDYDLYLAKLDTAGNLIWQKNYGGTYRQRGFMVKETYDEGFIIGGWNETTGSVITSFYLVKTAQNGDTTWIRSYPNGMQQYGQAVTQTTDSGFAICGTIQHSTTIGTNSYVIRTNANGDTLWTKILTSLGSGAAYDVKALPNNHIILTGYTFPLCAFPYLCELDENGTVIWQQFYTSLPCGWAYSVTKTTDNGFAIFGMDTSDYYLVKTDSAGNQQWFKTYNEGYSDYGYCVRQTSDGGFIMTGTTAMGAQSIDISLIKTDGQGNVITGVTGMTDEDEVVIYPNPAEKFVALTVPAHLRNKTLTFKIYNALGQQQIRSDRYHSPHRIDLTGMAPGLYYISVSSQGRLIAKKKLIIR